MNRKQGLDSIEDIRNMMERSSRFISLSGWSGVSAGIFALFGAWFAGKTIKSVEAIEHIVKQLAIIGTLTFVGALLSAFAFTWMRSRKTGVPIWGRAARQLLVSLAVPMFAGGSFILYLLWNRQIALVAPGCLTIYGIALFCGSRQTFEEIRYLAYSEMILGLCSLFYTGYGLYFWAAGFGLLHIIYGVIMWIRHEKPA
ncbi:MAG: hypothetical protein LBC98_07185 [Prevotellaceae bacterium]|nr:hypothetical protein [Prevotellaceae bacterium]